MLLKIYCSYISDFGKVQIGYFMCAEKRIHIGDRMKYMPMGYFNDHNLGNLTSVVTTTMGDIENNASMVLTNILGGYIHAAIIATVYKGNIIKNLIMDCQSYTKYRPNETTGGIFVSWRRKEELPTGA